MKKQYFSNLENKYYYGITRTFWHIITGLAVLGIVIGIFLMIWSYLPASKDKVVKAPIPEKESYPKQADVSLVEVMNALPVDRKSIEKFRNTNFEDAPPLEYVETTKAKDTVGLHAFETQIAYMRNLLPQSRYAELWNGSGKYVILDQVKWKITKQEKYRKYVKTSSGLKENIIYRSSDNGFKSYSDKALLVSKYNKLLRPIAVGNRGKIIDKLTYFKENDLQKTLSSLDGIATILSYYDPNDILEAFATNTRFLRRNPNDGLALLTFEAQILPEFSLSERMVASNYIKEEYINYYNNNLSGLKENVNNFSPLVRKIDSTKQAIALRYYFRIYRQKNVDRLERIRQIEADYANKISQIETDFVLASANAEKNYQIRKLKKGSVRVKSYTGLGLAIGAILIITILLLMLSMIRNVNRLAQAMLNSHKQEEKITTDTSS